MKQQHPPSYIKATSWVSLTLLIWCILLGIIPMSWVSGAALLFFTITVILGADAEHERKP